MLLVRVALTTAVIVLAVGLLTYYVQCGQLEREVADLGQRGALALMEKVRFVAERHETDAVAALREVLEKGEEMPIAARIFAVADVFDALTSHRPYKKPFSFEETVEIIERDRGAHVDPAVLDAFGSRARELYNRYAGQEGAGLKEALDAVVAKYFSAGMGTLRYGEGT